MVWATRSGSLPSITSGQWAGRDGQLDYPTPLAVPPNISLQPTDQTADQGSTVTFSVLATGSGTLSYQWKRQSPGGGAFVNVGTNNATYTTGVLSQASDNGANFQVVVTDDDSSIGSDVVSLTVTIPAVAGIATLTGWVNNTGTQHSTGEVVDISFHNPTTRALILNAPGSTINASGNLIITNSALVIGTTYSWFAESPTNSTWAASGKVVVT